MAYFPLWAASLQAASWRGLPFGVEESGYQTGRRVAVHEYPYKDSVWVEDLGLGRQQFSFSGFLLGDDVYLQRDAMAAACNQAGIGILVHPSIGMQTASLISASFGERKDAGRVVEVRFVFVLSQQPTFQNLYPIYSVDTSDAVLGWASTLDDGVLGDFFDDVDSALAYGESVVSSIENTVETFASQVIAAGQDAASALASVAGLNLLMPAGFELGRFAAGNVGLLNPALAAIDTTQSVFSIVNNGVSALVSAASTAQAGIQEASATVQTLAGLL